MTSFYIGVLSTDIFKKPYKILKNKHKKKKNQNNKNKIKVYISIFFY